MVQKNWRISNWPDYGIWCIQDTGTPKGRAESVEPGRNMLYQEDQRKGFLEFLYGRE